MKKIFYSLFVASFAIALVGCTRAEIQEPKNETPTGAFTNVVTITTTLDEGTKTAFDETGPRTSWIEADKGHFHARLNTVEGSLTPSISDGVLSATATFSDVAPAETYTYKGVVAANYESGIATIPCMQTATASGFDPDADVLVAKAISGATTQSTLQFQFAHVVSFNKMTLKNLPAGAVIDNVTISSADETDLTAIYDIDGDEFTGDEDAIIVDFGTDGLTVGTDGTCAVYFTSAAVKDAMLEIEVELQSGAKYAKTFEKSISFPMGSFTKFSVNLNECEVPLFYESFSGCDGTGGNDGKWSGSIASGTFKDGTSSDNTGWVLTKGGVADECIKLGTGSAKGSATTPEIAFTATDNYTINFKAAAWVSDSESTTLYISATRGTLSQSSVILKKGEFSDYSIVISGAEEGTQIMFEAAKATNSRFFLDEVKIVVGGEIPGDINVTGVSLNKDEITLDEGTTSKLIATVTPDDATNKDVSWSSDNTEVATVDQTGLVTAVAEGSATITVTTDDGGLTASCDVTVNAAAAGITSISGIRDAIVSTSSSSANAFEATLTDAVVTYVSGKNAFIEDAGAGILYYANSTITNLTAGQKINGKVSGSGYVYSGLKEVTNLDLSNANISEASADNIPVHVLTPAQLNADFDRYMSCRVKLVDVAVSATDKTVGGIAAYTYNSITLVDGAATVVGYPGNHNGNQFTIWEALAYKVTGVSLNKTTTTLGVGGTETLVATVSPSNAADKTVSWSSDNESVATVAEGVVTGVAGGTATITATTTDGAFTATCEVTVTAPVAVTGVSISGASSVAVGSTITLTATVTPSDATNRSVTWSSDDTSVATVNANGVVTGVAEGTATITVTTADGNFSDTCDVTVEASGDVTVLSEDFSGITSGDNTTSGGSSNAWSGNDNFPTVSKAYNAGGAVKLGTSSAVGSITSKSLSLNKFVNVSFDVKGWSSVEGNIKVTCGGQSVTKSYTATMSSSSFDSISIDFEFDEAATATVKIETTAKRAFIDNVVVTTH